MFFTIQRFYYLRLQMLALPQHDYLSWILKIQVMCRMNAINTCFIAATSIQSLDLNCRYSIHANSAKLQWVTLAKLMLVLVFV